jgi:uncharacterized protein YbjT (DUF2867 family)
MFYKTKSIPQTILVFGAAGHIGNPLVRYVRYKAPHISLRLVTTSAAKQTLLQKDFPTAEVVIADYYDPLSMNAVVEGMEGVFVVTPPYLDENRAMGNLISALKKAGSAIQIIRILGYEPESIPERVSPVLREFGSGTAVQHYVAKRLFDESGLPVTYINCGASFMDNLFGCAPALQRERKFIWANRWIPYIDPREVGEVAARILLSDDGRHIYQFHTINNGHDLMWGSKVAEIMSDVFQTTIIHDGSKEAFFNEYGATLEKRFGVKDIVKYRWEFFKYEQGNAVVWALNDFAERILERKPTTLRAWLMEHRKVLYPAAP